MKTILCLGLIAAVAVSVRAEPPQLPASAAPSIAITGRVIADATGDPIRNARVTLKPEPTSSAVMLTDADGRFSLTAPPGRYTVAASKTGYARSDVVAGQTIEVRLKKGAAISGRVVDGFGDPVQDVRVEVATPATAANEPITVATTDTDDRGEYRIASLPGGAFLAAITIATPVPVRGSSAISAAARKTYYPGVATLQPGDDQSGFDFVVSGGLASGLPVETLGVQVLRSARRGAGVVRGRVADLDGRAIQHALVFAFGATRTDSRAVATDENGRFELGALGTGTFRIGASKAGYTQVESGRALSPSSLDLAVVRAGTLSGFAWGRTIDLGSGDVRERVDLTMSRWGTLSGRVLDEYGEPIQGASVQLLHVRYEAGQRRLVPAQAVTGATDDLGRYRLHTLAPGQYIVSAAVGHASSEDLPGYTRSYYPGTPTPGEAQFVKVGLAQDVAAIDFSLSRVRTARVAGQVFDPAGKPANPGRLVLVPARRSSSVTSVAVGARIFPDDTFEFPNVAPGEYVIQASRGRSNPSTEGEFAALPVTVNGTDVTGLRLQISSGSSITGRITFDAVDPTTSPKPSELELSPIPADFDLSPQPNWASAAIHADWTFEMKGLNGPRRLQILRSPPGWALKEIRVNGIDVIDAPLPFGSRDQSLANVVVVMTDRVSELSGTVADDRARPAAGSDVVVFSTDRDRWYPASRYVRQTVTGTDGSFSVTGLPSGSYYASAVPRIPTDGEDAWQDPQFLESLVLRAATVSVVDGQKAQIALRLSSP